MKHNKGKWMTIFLLVLILCLTMTACKNYGDHFSDTPTEDSAATAEASDVNDNTSALTTDVNLPDLSSMPAETSDGGDRPTPEIGGETNMDYGQTYDALIAEWELALNHHNSEEYTEDDMLSFHFYGGYGGERAKAYYAFYDIDGNGTHELILRKEKSYEDIIAYIFTIQGGEAVNIFGYDDTGVPNEVPWSRVGSSAVLRNGLIDSINGDYTIYQITDDGCGVTALASSEPYDYPDMASLGKAKWRYYINNAQVDYDDYVQYLSEQGYMVNGNNQLAVMDWRNITLARDSR